MVSNVELITCGQEDLSTALGNFGHHSRVQAPAAPQFTDTPEAFKQVRQICGLHSGPWGARPVFFLHSSSVATGLDRFEVTLDAFFWLDHADLNMVALAKA